VRKIPFIRLFVATYKAGTWTAMKLEKKESVRSRKTWISLGVSMSEVGIHGKSSTDRLVGHLLGRWLCDRCWTQHFEQG
jgi:hypothetical protein